jgi:predicted hotdog family 3-hydroxylacyl-ACP dehydratase
MLVDASLLDRRWIMAHIPHQGAMCLLDEVIGWDTERITCRGRSHADTANPLRARGRLGILCGVEYAAQAMAVHGALTAGVSTAPVPTSSASTTCAAPPAAGFLAALRGVTAYVARLDDVPGPLTVTAARIAGDHASALYDFELRSTVRCLLDGRATVVLDTNGRLRT